MIAPSTIVGGRYRVVRSLGGGGMKLVYLAEDLRLAGRSCALAEMVDSITSPDLQQQAVAAFQREADMLAQLANEHIPRIFDRFLAVPEIGGLAVMVLAEDTVLITASAPKSAQLIADLGYKVITVDISEFEKLEGCVTCLSVRVR